MKASDAQDRAAEAARWFDDLQSRICARLEALDDGARFESTRWGKPADHRLKGGGQMRLLRGRVFEKAGVNVSHVWGRLSDAGMAQLPGAEQAGGEFIACGISLVTHPANPFVPTVHMNLRYLATSIDWIGGGADLTPTMPFAEDTADFHDALRAACDRYRAGAYQEYRDWCDRYFFLPHRNEPRGVGGIFFDNLNGGDWARDFAFLQGIAGAFLQVYPAIVERRARTSFTPADRERQLAKRGRYVEFNLVYDRGTRFGFMTDANPDAYLMSLPPLASW
ncbi:MAG: oxygen-dependent coproporphyrinogen oxidase [Gammaproteobacteria bacterium]